MLEGTRRQLLSAHGDKPLYFSGDASLLYQPCVAVVGSRQVSKEGASRARKLGRQLAEAGVVVMSGLAEGVDTEALSSAIQAGGRVIAVIGTPLDKVYPAKNASLQELIWKEHLLISQFSIGDVVEPGNFPQRNETMAAMSDGTVVVEASDKSGVRHQVAKCAQLKRWIFLLRSLAENHSIQWHHEYLRKEKTIVVDGVSDIIAGVSC